jgi:hypothetical protein
LRLVARVVVALCSSVDFGGEGTLERAVCCGHPPVRFVEATRRPGLPS